MTYSNALLSLIYPHKCTFCGDGIDRNNDKFICRSCEKSLPYLPRGGCLLCGTPTGEFALSVCFNCRRYRHAFSRSFTPLIYEGSVRRAVISMKFYNARTVSRSLAYLIADRILSEDMPHFDFITFVPASRSRLAERKFNQARLIADFLAEILHSPVIDAINRVDNSPRQTTLSFSERRANAKKSFFPKELSLSGTALLIDDVYTTGSTMDACSRILKKMGCEKVFIAAAAINLKF